MLGLLVRLGYEFCLPFVFDVQWLAETAWQNLSRRLCRRDRHLELSCQVPVLLLEFFYALLRCRSKSRVPFVNHIGGTLRST
jgi:hypothetical protein